MWPRVRCLNQTLLNYEFGVNSTSKLRVDHSKSTQTRKTNGKLWYSENCHVTALKVNTRVLPMDLDTRVPVISQPASPHHDIDAWGLRFAPRWRSLRWQSSICSSWNKLEEKSLKPPQRKLLPCHLCQCCDVPGPRERSGLGSEPEVQLHPLLCEYSVNNYSPECSSFCPSSRTPRRLRSLSAQKGLGIKRFFQSS